MREFPRFNTSRVPIVRLLVVAAVASLSLASPAGGQVLMRLLFDAADSTVTVSTTGDLPSAGGGKTLGEGVTLQNVFSELDAAVAPTYVLSGDFAANTTGGPLPPYNRAQVLGPTGAFALNFWTAGDDSRTDQAFDTSAPAFVGQGAFTLSLDDLPRSGWPGLGDGGDIFLGSTTSDTVIGRWVAVPEPGVVMLMAAGVLILTGRRGHS